MSLQPIVDAFLIGSPCVKAVISSSEYDTLTGFCGASMGSFCVGELVSIRSFCPRSIRSSGESALINSALRIL